MASLSLADRMLQSVYALNLTSPGRMLRLARAVLKGASVVAVMREDGLL
jgi:hypothetical protein